MARTDLQMNFRIPAELKARLEGASRESGRSLTQEIVQRLEQSFNLEPMKEAKRDELLKLVNEAIDERMGIGAKKPAALGARPGRAPKK